MLILGETGTGKELVAREIHRRSRRKDKALVRVNCASIPKDLYESEFFGHVRGAFTGAIKDRAGRFETAEGGTIFLDEIGEVPLELQSKLLRVLQEKRSLRERADDIAVLAKHFIELSVKELRCPKPRLTRAGIVKLQSYDWPGNIRELRNVIERAVIISRGGPLDFELAVTNSAPPTPSSKSQPGETGDKVGAEFLTEPEMLQRERENLAAVLDKANWKIKGADGAAELLGVKPTTLLSRIKKMGLKRPA